MEIYAEDEFLNKHGQTATTDDHLFAEVHSCSCRLGSWANVIGETLAEASIFARLVNSSDGADAEYRFFYEDVAGIIEDQDDPKPNYC